MSRVGLETGNAQFFFGPEESQDCQDWTWDFEKKKIKKTQQILPIHNLILKPFTGAYQNPLHVSF